MCINPEIYLDIKENSIPTVKIEVRIDGIGKGKRNPIAFVLKSKAFSSLVLKSEKVNKAIEEASKILTEAVREALIDGKRVK